MSYSGKGRSSREVAQLRQTRHKPGRRGAAAGKTKGFSPVAFSRRGRMGREAKTISTMVSLYCREQHGGSGLCSDCAALLAYGLKRLDKCPFQEGKTTCARCPVHCYRPDMRERIRTVMRYSGPRMVYRHPLMAVTHLMDSRRKEPIRRRRP